MQLTSWRLDAVSAWRAMRRQPQFTLIAGGTMALGIGAAATVFTLVNAVLVNGLPFDRADRLVFMRGVRQAQTPQPFPLGLMDIDALARNEAFEAIVPITGARPFNLAFDDDIAHVSGEMTGAAYFDILRVPMTLGRPFSPDETAPSTAQPVAVLSEGIWRRRFGARADIIDATIALNDRRFRVIGVAGPGFRGLSDTADVWLPIGLAGPIYGAHYTGMREFRWLSAVGRLRDGADLARAREIADATAAQLRATFPKENDRLGVGLLPLDDVLIGDLKAPIGALSGAALFVLVIACVNVASLLLARSRARVVEVAVRRALGAETGQLLRLLVFETAALSGAAAIGGIAIAMALPRLALALAPPGLFSFVTVKFDWTVLALAAAATLISALIAGIAPALTVLRQPPSRGLRQGSRGAASGGRHAFHRGLVVAEVALALALLVTAAAMARGLARFMAGDIGMRTDAVLTMRLDLTAEQYKVNDRYWSVAREVLARTAAVSGVVQAALEGPGFPTSGSYGISFRRPHAAIGDPDVSGLRHHVSPGYFAALGIPLLAGRDFTIDDRPGGERALIVSRAFADTVWPGQSPLGQRLLAGAGPDAPVLTVVGVSGNVRHAGRNPDAAWAPDVYISIFQSPARTPATLTVYAKTAVDPAEAARSIAAGVQQAAPGVPPYDIATLDERLRAQTSSGRFAVLTMALFAAIALLLAASGVYGVVSYIVGLRTREVGLRLALGSNRGAVLWLMLRTGLTPVALGIVVGVLAAWWSGRYLTSQLYGLDATEPTHVAATIAVLGIVAFAATLVPALRATRVPPSITLRGD